MILHISPRIRKKLAEKHGVSEDEIRQCFINAESEYLVEIREQHQTNPPTLWFIAETDRCKRLKVVFVPVKIDTPNGKTLVMFIKTAFPPSPDDEFCYQKFSRPKT